jgi:hypothetical protein
LTKKPRRLGRGFCSLLEGNHRPLGGGQCSQQRYLTTSRRAEQINFRLWAGGHFTLRKPLCAYGLIAQPVQLSALPGRAPTNPSPPGRGSFYFGPPQLAASFISNQACNVGYWHLASIRARALNGRYWGHSGHWSARARDGSAAIDPSATLAVHCGNVFDAGFSPYQSTRLSR